MKGSRSIGNGGSTSRYVWTQTLKEVTVHVPIPDGLRAKDLVVLDPADEGGGGGEPTKILAATETTRYWITIRRVSRHCRVGGAGQDIKVVTA